MDTLVTPDSRRHQPPVVSERQGVTAVFLFTFALRVVTRASFPTDWDSSNLTIGVGFFDVTDDAPHAPGYWLYIRAGRLIEQLSPFGAHTSLVLVSATASAATAALVYLIARRLTSLPIAVVTTALVVTSPITWFYGSIVATYSFDSLASVALVYLALRASPSSRHLTVAVIVVALAAGFRPSIAVLYGPALLLILARTVRRPGQLIEPAVVGAVAIAAWLVPMILEQPGGFSAWFDRTEQLWSGAADATSTFRDGPAAATNRQAALAQTILTVSPALGGLAVALAAAARAFAGRRSRAGDVWRLTERRSDTDQRPLALLGIAAVAGPTFFVAVFVHFPKPGYLLSYSAVLLLGVGLLMPRETGRLSRSAVAALGLGVIAQTGLYVGTDALMPERLAGSLPEYFTSGTIGSPYPYTWEEIRRVDQEGRAFERLAEQIDPDRDVVLLAADNGGYRYRLASTIIRDVPVFYVSTLSTEFPAVIWVSRDGRLRGAEGWGLPGRSIEMPPDGRAYLVLDVPTGQIPDRERFGTATRLPLAPPPPTLDFLEPAIWVLDPTGDPLEVWR